MHNPNRVFAGIFFIAFVLVYCSSCITDNKRAKICATCQHTDSLTVLKHDTIIVRDTTLFLSFQGDTVQIPCPEAKPFDIIKKLNGIKTEVRSNGKKVECICSDDSLKLVIAKIRTDHYSEIYSIKNETHTIDCQKRHHTGWDTFCNWFTLIGLFCFAIVVVIGVLQLMGKLK